MLARRRQKPTILLKFIQVSVLSEHTCGGPGFVSWVNLELGGNEGELVTKHLFIEAESELRDISIS